MFIEWFVKTSFGASLTRRLQKSRTNDIVRDLAPLLQRGEHILDIGAGGCTVAAALRDQGHTILPVDVRDQSCIPDLRPQVFDGRTLPFPDQSFDVALLITILHHIPDPDQSLREAKRVAKRLIIQEDIYTSTTQRWLTYVMDSMLNLEFFGHPHTNRDDRGWKRTFTRLGLGLKKSSQKSFWRFFRSATYVVTSAPLKRPTSAKKIARS